MERRKTSLSTLAGLLLEEIKNDEWKSGDSFSEALHLDCFSYNLKDSEALKNARHKEGYCYYKVSDGAYVFEDSLTHGGIFNFEDWLGLDIPSVFIPTTEMLSHAKGFLAMNQKYNMPFDGTQVDIIVNASLPGTREIPDSCKAILDPISDVIDGTVIQEDDTFYVLKKDGRFETKPYYDGRRKAA